MKKITDLAKIIRSKNSSPFQITLDIIFQEKKDYQTLKQKKLITKPLIAKLYQTQPEKVLKIIYFDPASAIKIVLKRQTPSGSFGDSDVYGAQQHTPLLALESSPKRLLIRHSFLFPSIFCTSSCCTASNRFCNEFT